jgi:hypothetical protein
MSAKDPKRTLETPPALLHNVPIECARYAADTARLAAARQAGAYSGAGGLLGSHAVTAFEGTAKRCVGLLGLAL